MSKKKKTCAECKFAEEPLLNELIYCLILGRKVDNVDETCNRFDIKQQVINDIDNELE